MKLDGGEEGKERSESFMIKLLPDKVAYPKKIYTKKQAISICMPLLNE